MPRLGAVQVDLLVLRVDLRGRGSGVPARVPPERECEVGRTPGRPEEVPGHRFRGVLVEARVAELHCAARLRELVAGPDPERGLVLEVVVHALPGRGVRERSRRRRADCEVGVVERGLQEQELAEQRDAARGHTRRGRHGRGRRGGGSGRRRRGRDGRRGLVGGALLERRLLGNVLLGPGHASQYRDPDTDPHPHHAEGAAPALHRAPPQECFGTRQTSGGEAVRAGR